MDAEIGTSGSGYNVAIQNDGKIVVAGWSYNGSNYDFGLVRYNSNGSLDTNFNGTGKVTTAVGAGDDLAFSVAIQGDGKIVVAGDTGDNGTVIALVRYNTNGSLDTSFNGTGKVITSSGSGYISEQGVAIQGDGKIVVAGTYYNGSNYDFSVVRYNTNGSLDTNFNGTGKVNTDFDNGNDYGFAVAIQSDGKIVVSGSSGEVRDLDFSAVRYNIDGSLDTSWNGTGTVSASFGNGEDECRSVAIQGDGKIVVAGWSGSDNGTNFDFMLLRYNIDGSQDTSFGSAGRVSTDFDDGDDYGTSVRSKATGKSCSRVGRTPGPSRWHATRVEAPFLSPLRACCLASPSHRLSAVRARDSVGNSEISDSNALNDGQDVNTFHSNPFVKDTATDSRMDLR